MQGNIKQTCQAKSILCQVRRKPETNSLMPREKGNYKRDKYTLLKLFRGQKMHIQYPEIKIWNPTKIINTGKTPRSYIIMTESNNWGTTESTFTQLYKKNHAYAHVHICGWANTNKWRSYDQRDHKILSANSKWRPTTTEHITHIITSCISRNILSEIYKMEKSHFTTCVIFIKNKISLKEKHWCYIVKNRH